MKRTRIWGFTHEENAKRCAALIASGDNAECAVEYNEVDEAWEVLFKPRLLGNDAEVVAWLRGFACGFARTITEESDVG